MTTAPTEPLHAKLTRYWTQLREGPLKPFAISTRSLAFRLFVTSALWTLLALPLTAWVLSALYREELERDFDTRLKVALELVVATSVGVNGTEPQMPSELGDEYANLYSVPSSGYYWQIRPLDDPEGRMLVSPSLLDVVLDFSAAKTATPAGKSYRIGQATEQKGREVRFIEQIVTFGRGAAAKRYSYIVTARLDELEASIARFRNRLLTALAVFGLGLAGVTFYQVRYGLKPLAAIEQGLAAIRSGKVSRLEGELPDEIQPLQRELNELIRSNEEIIERARTHVGNLAHALKTPLSVITNEAQAESTPFARKVSEQAAIMRNQVGHHLDRARMVARTATMGSVTEVRPAAEALVRTLAKIFGRERGIQLSLECPADARFNGEKQDLEEMLGNLLENACKWADSEIRLTVARLPPADRHARAQLSITVDDDGPGLTPEQRQGAIKRGRRLDETKPGSGLGLSIVSDLAGLYGGRFELEKAALGGLSARLTLPAA
jgi:signal transduction histidine kinase